MGMIQSVHNFIKKITLFLLLFFRICQFGNCILGTLHTSDLTDLVLVLGGVVPLVLFRNIPAELTGLQEDIQVPPSCYFCIAAVNSVS